MRVQLDLLGQFRVVVDGRATTAADWRRSRSVTLVKLLALAPRRRMHRELVIEALWPELSLEAGSANLRKAIFFARRALGAQDVIGLDGETVTLAPGAEIAVDSEQFEADAKAALRADDPAACMRAAQRYVGELLPEDRYADWTEEPRERLRQLYVQTLKKAGLWEKVLTIDPTDEGAQRALMQAALEAGDRGEVIRQFQRLRERLRIDLGVGPSAATMAIYDKALKLGGSEQIGIAESVRGQIAWGLIHLNSGDFQQAERKASEARTMAFEGELAREVGEASALLGLVAHMQGRWQELFRSEFSTWARPDMAMASNVFDGHVCLAQFCLCKSDGHQEMAVAAKDLLTVAERAGSVHGRALATLILGQIEQVSGRYGAAEALLTSAEKLNAESGSSVGRALALQSLGEIALVRGQKWRAGRFLQRGLSVAEASWLAPHLLISLQGLAVQAASNSTERVVAIEQGDRWLAERCMCQPCSMGFRVAASIAMSEDGELDEAGRRIGEAERIAGMWQGGPWVAAVWEARGVHRGAQGEGEQASALLREAAARFAEVGRPGDQERCLARAKAFRHEASA